jgi:L-rhamnose isomerase
MFKVTLIFVLFFCINSKSWSYDPEKVKIEANERKKQKFDILVDHVFRRVKKDSIAVPSWAVDVGGTLLVPYSKDYDYTSDTGIG